MAAPGTADFSPSTIPDTDLSLQILQYLFPDLVAKIMGGTGGAGATGAGVLADLFYAFNTFCAFALGLILLYISLVGIANSAHEGEPLGKQFSTLWTPVKMVTGLAFVVPIGALKGFSLLQAIIILLVCVSISGANYLYRALADYFAANATILPIAASQIPANQIQMLTANAGCMAAYNKQVSELGERIQFYDDGKGHWIWGRSNKDPACGEAVLSCGEAENAVRKATNSNGMIDVSKTESVSALAKYNMCRKTQIAFSKLLTQINSIADAAVNLEGPIPDNLKGQVTQAVQTYFDAVDAEFKSQVQQATSSSRGALQAMKNEMIEKGWVSAGSWFYAIAKTSADISSLGDFRATVSGHQPAKIPKYDELVKPEIARAMEIAMRGSDDIANIDVAGVTGGRTIESTVRKDTEQDADGIIAKILGKPLLYMSGTWKLTANALQSGDPITALAGFGHYMIGTAAGIYTAYAGMVAASEGIGSALSSIPLAGGLLGALAKGAGAVLAAMGAGIFSIVSIIFVAGIMLAYYLPMIPAIYWFLGLAGWLVSIMLTLIAAPIWAVAHAAPDNVAGPAAARAMQGYQLLASVVLKPILMLITLFASYMGSVMIVRLVVSLFGAAMDSTISGTASFSALIGMIAAPVLLAIIVIMIIQMVFDTIFSAPDHILRFIGFGAFHLGEQGASARVGAAWRVAGEAAGRAADKATEAASRRGEGLRSVPVGGKGKGK